MKTRRLILVMTAALLLNLSAARADGLFIEAGGNAFNLHPTSLKLLGYRTIWLQQYDFSCGSAALASLLTFHYGRPHLEEDVFKAMYSVGDQEKIRQNGFSLLDMKAYLDSIGLPADGFHLTLDKVAELRVPAITLIEFKGYKHFVIIKGIKDGRVLLGDPARGVYAVKQQDFAQMWTGIVLYVKTEIAAAQASFDPETDWAAQGRAPIGMAFGNQGLGSFTANLPAFGKF